MNPFQSVDLSYDNVNVIPKGDYELVIIDAEASSGDTGVKVTLQFQVLSGPFQNRKFKQWFTFSNDPSRKTGSDIAKSQLDKICQAVGTAISKLNEHYRTLLCGKPFVGSVIIRPAKDGFEESNAVTKASPRGTPQQPTMPLARPTQSLQPSVNQQGAQPKAATPWG